MSEPLRKLSLQEMKILFGVHIYPSPTLRALELARQGRDHYYCMVSGCPLHGSADKMCHIGRFVLCPSHAKRFLPDVRKIRPEEEVYLVIQTIANVTRLESRSRDEEERHWLEEEHNILAKAHAALKPPRQPTPAPQPALVVAAVAIAAPASAVVASVAPVPAPSAPVPATDPSGEVAKLNRQLAKLVAEESDPDSVMTLDEIAAKRAEFTARLAALTGEVAKLNRQLAKLVAEESDPDSVMTQDEIEGKRKAITLRMAELGAAPVVVSAPAPVPTPVTPPAAPVVAAPAVLAAPEPIDGSGNRRFGLEVRPGAAPLPRQELKRRAVPAPVQVMCSGSGGTRQGNPIALAGSVEPFDLRSYEQVEACFVKLGDLKRKIFDHIYPHAAPDADDTKLRDFRSAEFKAARKETFQCKLCGKKLAALEGLRKAVIEFGKSNWPDRWQGRRDEEGNGTGTLKCANHPSKGLFGLLFDRVNGAPLADVGPDNVCGACHKTYVNKTEGPRRAADRHARQEERGKASAEAKGKGGGGGNKQKKGGKK